MRSNNSDEKISNYLHTSYTDRHNLSTVLRVLSQSPRVDTALGQGSHVTNPAYSHTAPRTGTAPLVFHGQGVHNNVPHGFVDTSIPGFGGLNQTGTGQGVGFDQSRHPVVPNDAGPFANYGNEEPVAGWDVPIDYFGAPFDPQASYSGAPHAFESTANANGNVALPRDFFNQWPPSFPPSTQTAAGGPQGWIGGDFGPDLTAHDLSAGGRPMDGSALPHADTTTSHIHTALPPLRLAPTRRRRARQTGGFPCTEGCGKIMNRQDDVRRHVAQVHGPPTLPCPVDGCGKMFARQDKRRDHLKRGHKLGERAIDAIYNALSDEQA